MAPALLDLPDPARAVVVGEGLLGRRRGAHEPREAVEPGKKEGREVQFLRDAESHDL